MMDRVIDLDEEYFDLLKKEEIFAFFDFSLRLPGDRNVSGLCKVSRPKSEGAGSHYFAMVFILDAADDAVCQALNEYFKAIDWEDLRGSVPGIVSFVAMPHLSQRAGVYIKEVDVYLTAGNLTRHFLEGFYSSLTGVMKISGENPIYLDDMPQDPKPITSSKPPSAPATSYLDRLRKRLR